MSSITIKNISSQGLRIQLVTQTIQLDWGKSVVVDSSDISAHVEALVLRQFITALDADNQPPTYPPVPNPYLPPDAAHRLSGSSGLPLGSVVWQVDTGKPYLLTALPASTEGNWQDISTGSGGGGGGGGGTEQVTVVDIDPYGAINNSTAYILASNVAGFNGWTFTSSGSTGYGYAVAPDANAHASWDGTNSLPYLYTMEGQYIGTASSTHQIANPVVISNPYQGTQYPYGKFQWNLYSGTTPVTDNTTGGVIRLTLRRQPRVAYVPPSQ